MRRILALLLTLPLASLAACDSDSGTPGPTAFTCTDGVSTFQACGGDPTGDWSFTSVCVSGEALFARTTMKRDCPQAKADVAMDWTGTATFRDGQIVFALATQAATTTLTIPDICLLRTGVACADAVTEPGYSCAAGTAGTCVCRQETSGTGGPAQTMAYTVDGTALVTTAGTGEERMDFCVKDGMLALSIRVGEDAPVGEYGSSSAPAILSLRKD